MIPVVLLNFVGIFAALLSFIITLVLGIKTMYSEMGPNDKLHSFPVIIFWFLLISKLIQSTLDFCVRGFNNSIIFFCLVSFHCVSVVLWHFTAVSCSVCRDVEEEVAEEEEFRRTGERHDEYGER